MAATQQGNLATTAPENIYSMHTQHTSGSQSRLRAGREGACSSELLKKMPQSAATISVACSLE